MTEKLTILLLLFVNSLLFSSELTTTRFAHHEMLVMTVEEWDKKEIDNTNIRFLLDKYHATATFKQSLEDYKRNPELYFSERLHALELLLAEIVHADNKGPILEKLQRQVSNKISYIKAIPDMRLVFNKPERPPITKSLPMHENYRFEFWDPLHRDGAENEIYICLWMLSDIPNFFIYLDSIENDPRIFLFAPLRQTIYYTENERAGRRLSFKDGLAYLNGELFDSKKFSGEIAHTIYVLGSDKHFYVENDINNLYHSTIFSGGELICAGEMIAEEGKITMINNYSGHYQPKETNLQECLTVLKEATGTLADLNVLFRYRTGGESFKFIFEGEEFLAKQSAALPKNAPELSLHYAVRLDKREWISLGKDNLLLECKYKGNTPLHVAARVGSIFWVEGLLKLGASPYVLNDEGQTPLEVAAANGKLDAVRAMYAATKNEIIRNKAIFAAASSGDTKTLFFFQQKGISFWKESTKGNTIFHYAAKAPNPTILEYLLKHAVRSKVYKANKSGKTPLYYAAKTGCPQTLKTLINLGLNPNSIDTQGNTLFHAAAKKGNAKAFEYLLPILPADYLLKANTRGSLPIHYASPTLSLPLFGKILETGGNINTQNKAGETPLSCTFNSSSEKSIINFFYLLEKGADPSIRNEKGLMPIHKAATMKKERERPLPLMLILSTCEALTETTSTGEIPLHCAILAREIPNIKYLLKYTTAEHLSLRNSQGSTALDLAYQTGCLEIIELVLQKISDLSSDTQSNPVLSTPSYSKFAFTR